MASPGPIGIIANEESLLIIIADADIGPMPMLTSEYLLSRVGRVRSRFSQSIPHVMM